MKKVKSYIKGFNEYIGINERFNPNNPNDEINLEIKAKHYKDVDSIDIISLAYSDWSGNNSEGWVDCINDLDKDIDYSHEEYEEMVFKMDYRKAKELGFGEDVIRVIKLVRGYRSSERHKIYLELMKEIFLSMEDLGWNWTVFSNDTISLKYPPQVESVMKPSVKFKDRFYISGIYTKKGIKYADKELDNNIDNTTKEHVEVFYDCLDRLYYYTNVYISFVISDERIDIKVEV